MGAAFYCRKPLTPANIHVDHFIPWALGGSQAQLRPGGQPVQRQKEIGCRHASI